MHKYTFCIVCQQNTERRLGGIDLAEGSLAQSLFYVRQTAKTLRWPMVTDLGWINSYWIKFLLTIIPTDNFPNVNYFM